jgi:hypothetical protein
MNERIRELAEQCESFGSWDNKTYTFDKEKFAELIVMECILTIQLKMPRDGSTPENIRSREHVQDIKQHFGVES